MAAIEKRGAGRSNEERIEDDMIAKIAGCFGYKNGDEMNGSKDSVLRWMVDWYPGSWFQVWAVQIRPIRAKNSMRIKIVFRSVGSSSLTGMDGGGRFPEVVMI